MKHKLKIKKQKLHNSRKETCNFNRYFTHSLSEMIKMNLINVRKIKMQHKLF